jgi:hypothetical protein
MQRPKGTDSAATFLVELGAAFSMNTQAIAVVAATFTKNGTYLVSQLKECTQAVVQDACASIPGFPAVISAFLVAEGETPHVFEEPLKPTGRGAAPPRSTGGPCGNDPNKQFAMDPLEPLGMTLTGCRFLSSFASGITADVTNNRTDTTRPVSKSHVKCIVRNLAHHFLLLFGCLYLSSPAEGERALLPKAYMVRTCKVLVEYFSCVGPGFECGLNSCELVKKVTNRVRLHHHLSHLYHLSHLLTAVCSCLAVAKHPRGAQE